MKLQDHLYNEIILSIALFALMSYFSALSKLTNSGDLSFLFLILSPGLILGILLKPSKFWYIIAWVLLIITTDYYLLNFHLFQNLFESTSFVEKTEWIISNMIILFFLGYIGIVIGYILRKKLKKEKMTTNGYNTVIFFFALLASFFAGSFGGYAISVSHSTIQSVIISLLIYFLPGFIYYLSFRKNISWLILGFLLISTMIAISSDIISLTDGISFERYIQEITNQIPIILAMVTLSFSFGYIVKDFIKKISKNERF